MTYLLRVVLPDRPGMLGALATALGEAGADILSLDVVERGPEGAVDDLVVALPPGGLADRLLTAARSVDGAVVEHLRPHHGATDLHPDLALVDALAAEPARALLLLVEHCPAVFRAGWSAVVERGPAGARALHATSGAPALPPDLPWLPLPGARRLDARADDVPHDWRALGTELAAAPVGRPDLALLLGRPGGPAFRASEVLRLAHLAGITATVLSAAA